MKAIGIVQARMGSTRLPGKVMRTLVGQPMVCRVVERVRRVPSIDEVVVATSVETSDQPLVDYLNQAGIPVFRGGEHDVLARYYNAALSFDAEVVVRITADCPLISPCITDRTVRVFLDTPESVDYVSNTLTRTYPRGLDTEVFSFETLEKAYREATSSSDREHVTSYVWRRPEVFRLGEVVSKDDNSHLRWTVDVEADFTLIQKIYDALHPQNPDFDYRDVLDLLHRHPDWLELNKHVEQKYA